MTLQLRVYVPDHPLIKHWLTVARDRDTPPVLFRSAMVELGRWLTYEACRHWLPTAETTVETPLTATSGTVINPQLPLAIIPILRAGLALQEGAQTLLPLASTYHLGLVRDEDTLNNSIYLNKLPVTFASNTHILVVDPMLATGGSMMTAMAEITKRGGDPALMRIIAVVAAPQALQQLSQNYPSLTVYAAILDEGLNEKGYIVPGLGDAGDRAFGT